MNSSGWCLSTWKNRSCKEYWANEFHQTSRELERCEGPRWRWDFWLTVCPFPRLFLEVRILKDFKSSVFGSADSKRVTHAIFVSADSKEFTREKQVLWRKMSGAGECAVHSN